MAITINDVDYEQEDLAPGVVNSIAQVQNANNAIAQLQAELLNHQIIKTIILDVRRGYSTKIQLLLLLLMELFTNAILLNIMS